VRLINWSEITEYVLQLPHQQDVWMPKESVVHPQTLIIPYSWGAYRFTTRDGRAIDIKEYPDRYLIHWDYYNPSIHPVEHCFSETPIPLFLLIVSLLGLVGKAMSSKN